MNLLMKSSICCAFGLLGLQGADAQSCADQRRVVYEVERLQPEYRVVEVVKESPQTIQYNNTVVRQTFVYNVVNITAPAPAEPRLRYSYVNH